MEKGEENGCCCCWGAVGAEGVGARREAVRGAESVDRGVEAGAGAAVDVRAVRGGAVEEGVEKGGAR